MALRDTFLNMLGVETQEVQKTSNGAIRSARDFLRNGSRERLYPTWSDIKMSDSDMYRGYSYAVIQKRGNKVASLAKNNLKTWANPEVVDEFQKKNETVLHPYLKLIEDSTKFTEKQFWKNISIYLDLAGRYYLGVVRSTVKPLNPNLPAITTDPTEFIMLNPYEVRRVVDKNGMVAGYIERKKDGRYREWPVHQIIEFRELNPFDPENSQWAMTDAAKNAVYTINQSGDYTRQSLNGNIDAPGIITTDVLLNDEDFANFKSRVTQHTKGEPLFGNGTGAIRWDSMQIDLDKAALLDINEINRTELFAVSGTSKTSLGIEQSGTTRETARVQSEQFISDTAQPRLEDIVDFLNLDYKKYYNREYKKTGYSIEVESAVGKDYDTEQKATALKQSQFQLAMQLIQAGYTTQSAYQFAEGEIDFADLELEKGIDKPKNPDQPEEPDESASNPQNTPPESGSSGGDDTIIVSDEKSGSNDESGVEDLNGLEPHSDLVGNSLEGEERSPLAIEEVENGGKGSGNFGHSGRPGEIGGSGKGVVTFTKSAEATFEKFPQRKKDFDRIVKDFQKNGLTRGFTLTTNAYDVAQEDEKRDFFSLGQFSGRTRTDTADGETLVYISPEVFQDGYGKKYNFETDGKAHCVDTTFEGTLRHELGHLFVTQLYLDEWKPKGELSQESFDRYNRNLLFNSKAKRPFLGGKWSSYADLTSGETIAEAFSNPDYSEDTRQVYDYVRKYKPIKKNAHSNSGVVLYTCVGYPINEKVLEEALKKVEKENHCTCEHDHKVETFINEVSQDDGKVVDKAYKEFLKEVRAIEKETINYTANKLEINAFEESDIIGKRKKINLINKLKNAIHKYWWVIFPLFANSSMSKRNKEFQKSVEFIFTNDLQNGVDDNALKVAEGHINTILGDILEASNRAYTKVLENAAAELIIKVYDTSPGKLTQYFDHKPTMAEALSSIHKTDILEENRRIYEKANKMAFEGYKREDITKAIREEYADISENRATLIARNETSRAFTRSQFEADKQFLNGVGKLDQAYKVWYSRRPASEQDKICDFCNEMIRISEEDPIPFEDPFLAYGDSMEVLCNDGKLRIFTANYEDIEGGCLHPNCQCGYYLVFKNDAGEFVKTLNEGPNDKTTNGGKGSGNFGHVGREGEVGGSASKGFTSGKALFEAEMDNKLDAFRKLTPNQQAVFCEKAMEIDYKDMPQDLANTDFQRISYALGIKDKPKTVSDEEFEKLAKEGNQEYFRALKANGSLTAQQVAERLHTGEYTYQGNGDYCDGTYFAESWDAMASYLPTDHGYPMVGAGAVVRCLISPQAKIQTHKDRMTGGGKIGETMEILESKTGMKMNTSRAVALLAAGYDGFSFNNGDSKKEYICMLNRRHLTVNNENYLPMKAKYEGGDDVE